MIVGNYNGYLKKREYNIIYKDYRDTTFFYRRDAEISVKISHINAYIKDIADSARMSVYPFYTQDEKMIIAGLSKEAFKIHVKFSIPIM